MYANSAVTKYKLEMPNQKLPISNAYSFNVQILMINPELKRKSFLFLCAQN